MGTRPSGDVEDASEPCRTLSDARGPCGMLVQITTARTATLHLGEEPIPCDIGNGADGFGDLRIDIRDGKHGSKVLGVARPNIIRDGPRAGLLLPDIRRGPT